MGWYFCSGCGPSVRCDVCGATECAQEIHAKARAGSCTGCVYWSELAKAAEATGKGIPWNVQRIPDGVRGWKHLRRRQTRIRRHRHAMDKAGVFADTRTWVRKSGRWVKNSKWGIDELFFGSVP